MYKVCLTNDDGPRSESLLKLAEAFSKTVELIVVVPDAQRSATGKSLTLKRPIRITEKHENNGYKFVSHDGAPERQSKNSLYQRESSFFFHHTNF